MPEETAFRQVDEKHVSVEVEMMVWSPKIDLIALSNVNGEVVLHRLSWQKVWSRAPPTEGAKVTSLAWRPDGKVLAVGYNTGMINLCDIENSEVLHHIEMSGEVTCLNWVSQVFTGASSWTAEPYPEDNTSLYLPRLQPLNKSYGTLNKEHVEENVDDSKKLKDQKELNLLLVGTRESELQMFAYGIFPVAYVPLNQLDNTKKLVKIQSAVISQDLQSLSVVLITTHGDKQLDLQLFTYDTKLLASRHKEIRLLALKYGQVAALLGYLQSTIQQMSEAWEDILMEMDSKLLKFAEDKKKTGSGTVSNDFLELLLFGTPSHELQAFLLHELAEKGLKKLGLSIETSYSNVQKMVVKHLQNVSQALLYHLNDLRGMSKWFDRFGVLGLEVQNLHETVRTAGSFVLKTSELQQVIDGSIKNFKAFFRWLYVVILRLSDEQPPAELSKLTQHDISFVAEFLRDNFAHFSEDAEVMSEENGDKKPGFKLEKVGQYLKKEDLCHPMDTSENPWIQYLKATVNLQESDVLYPIENKKSLVQLQEQLENSINSSLTRPAGVIGKSLHCAKSLHLASVKQGEPGNGNFIPRVCQFTLNESQRFYTVFTTEYLPSDKFYIIRQKTTVSSEDVLEIAAVKIGTLGHNGTSDENNGSESHRCGHHKILDISVYNEKTMSLLLVEATDDCVPVLVQLSFSFITDDYYVPVRGSDDLINSSNIKTCDVGSHVDDQNFRRLENMKAHSFAVSGIRKTASVLFSSRRRVRLFLMDAEEEDDEDDEEEEEEMDEGQDDSQVNQGDGQSSANQSREIEDDENKENTSFTGSEN